MIPCLHFGLRPVSGRFPIEPKLASWVESGYKSPESPGPRQRGRRRDGLSRRRRGRLRSTAPYPAATNSRGVSKPRVRRDNGLTFSVVIPAYNEERGIALVIDAIRARNTHCEIVVVDDGSTDGTASAAESAGSIVLRHPANGGYGQGHRIKIGGLGRMANSAFGGKLNLCGTSSHVFTMFVVALVVDNKYNVYVR